MQKNISHNIVVFSAHTDDFVIGAGGTIAKYTQEGKKVTVVVFSLGEKSHPWLKESVIKDVRAEEALRAGKVLGCEVIYFDLKDQDILKEYREKKIEPKLLSLLNKIKPEKIITHSSIDSHLSPGMLEGKDDHKAVNKITMEIFSKLKHKPELYAFSVWTLISFKNDFPRIMVDVSNTFSTKIKALQEFPSQRFNAIYPLIILILYRSIKDGLKIGKLFGESFIRIK